MALKVCEAKRKPIAETKMTLDKIKIVTYLRLGRVDNVKNKAINVRVN